MNDSVVLEKKILICAMCSLTFKEPKILSCLHRFCERCLDGWIKGHHTQDKYGRTGFPCPECSEFTEVRNDRYRPEKWAAAIRTDDYLKNMISYFAPRKEQNNHRPLQKLEHPYLVHRDKDFFAWSTETRISLPGPHRQGFPCLVHTDKVCDLYCLVCCKAVCHLCAGSLHKRCGQVTTLREVATERRAALEIRLKQAIDKRDAALEMKVSLENCWGRYNANKNAVEEEVRKWGQVTRQCIEEEEKKLLHQLNEEFSHRKNQVFAKINPFLENIHRSSEKLDSALNAMTSKSDFDLMCDNSVNDDLTEFEKREIKTMEDCQDVVRVLSKASINVANCSQVSVPKPHITFIDNDHEKILLQSFDVVVKI